MTDKQRAQNIQHQLIQMTAAFCQQHADGEYERLCRKLIEKMARKRAVPFLSGAWRSRQQRSFMPSEASISCSTSPSSRTPPPIRSATASSSRKSQVCWLSSCFILNL